MEIFKRLSKSSQDNSASEPSKNYRKTGLNTNPSNYGWYTCVHCGKKFRKNSIQIDHIIPQSKGGTNRPENLQCLCAHCNHSKGNRMEQTKDDLKKRKGSYNEYKRGEVLKPKVQEERKKISLLMRQFSNDEILSMMRLYQKKDIDVYNDLKKEAKRRKLKSL